MVNNLCMFLCILATVEARLEIYKQAETKHPRAMCPRRLPMNFLSGIYSLYCIQVSLFSLFNLSSVNIRKICIIVIFILLPHSL